VFVRHLALFPNWTAFLLLAVLPQQVVVALCVVAIPAATLYLQKSFKPTADASVLLGVMLGYSYLLFLGFFNFLLGCALFAFAVGHWRRHRRLGPLYLLLVATYVTHALPFAAALLALVLLERRWRPLLPLAPAFVLAAIDAWPRLQAAREYRSFGWHLEKLRALGPFSFIGDAHLYLASAVTLLIVISLAFTRRRSPAMLLTAAFLALFLLVPWGTSQIGWMSDRFLLLAVMTLPAWLEIPRPLVPLLAIVAVLHFALTWRDIATLRRGVEEVARCRAAIPEHTTLDVAGEAPALAANLQPLRHAPAYLALGHDIAWLGDYEARLDDFPVRFRPGAPNHAQYVLAWGGAGVEGAEVCRGEGFRLVKRAW
jgi:hypothetical protein